MVEYLYRFYTKYTHCQFYITDNGNIDALATAGDETGRGVCNAEGETAGQQEGTANSLLTAPLSFPGTLSNVVNSTLRLNGQERMVTRNSSYYSKFNHTNTTLVAQTLVLTATHFINQKNITIWYCNYKIDNAELKLPVQLLVPSVFAVDTMSSESLLVWVVLLTLTKLILMKLYHE